MSKHKKNGHKKNQPSQTEKILLVTVIVQLISAIVELINKLLSG